MQLSMAYLVTQNQQLALQMHALINLVQTVAQMLVTTVPQQLCRQTDTANLQLGKHKPISTAAKRRERKRRCQDKHQGFHPAEGNPDQNDQDECDPNRSDSGEQGAEHRQSDRQNADPESKQCNQAYHQTDQPNDENLATQEQGLEHHRKPYTARLHSIVANFQNVVKFVDGWERNTHWSSGQMATMQKAMDDLLQMLTKSEELVETGDEKRCKIMLKVIETRGRQLVEHIQQSLQEFGG